MLDQTTGRAFSDSSRWQIPANSDEPNACVICIHPSTAAESGSEDETRAMRGVVIALFISVPFWIVLVAALLLT
jgi:hypothetical protein